MKANEASDTDLLEVPVRTRKVLDPALRAEILAAAEEQGQVTVHCTLKATMGDAIRIWPSTYLVCRLTGHRSGLLHAEGIPNAPDWRMVPPGGSASFTLLFEALPSECVLFDLVEDIQDDGGFFSPAILRNGMDVYRVEV